VVHTIIVDIDEQAADGLCAIDIVMKAGVSSDTASAYELASAALILLEGCVKSDRNQGGIVGRLGKRYLEMTYDQTCQITFQILIKRIRGESRARNKDSTIQSILKNILCR